MFLLDAALRAATLLWRRFYTTPCASRKSSGGAVNLLGRRRESSGERRRKGSAGRKVWGKKCGEGSAGRKVWGGKRGEKIGKSAGRKQKPLRACASSGKIAPAVSEKSGTSSGGGGSGLLGGFRGRGSLAAAPGLGRNGRSLSNEFGGHHTGNKQLRAVIVEIDGGTLGIRSRHNSQAVGLVLDGLSFLHCLHNVLLGYATLERKPRSKLLLKLASLVPSIFSRAPNAETKAR